MQKSAILFDEVEVDFEDEVEVEVKVEVTWVVVRPVCSASSRFSLGEG